MELPSGTIIATGPLRPLLYTRPEDGKLIVLIHYLAERIGDIAPGPETIAWDWFDIDKLPSNCASNVYEIIGDYIKNNLL